VSTYPADLYPGCPCYKCDQEVRDTFYPTRMSLCPVCGSKRCPGAADHRDHQEDAQ